MKKEYLNVQVMIRKDSTRSPVAIYDDQKLIKIDKITDRKDLWLFEYEEPATCFTCLSHNQTIHLYMEKDGRFFRLVE